VPTAADSVLPAWSQRLLSELDAADHRAESIATGLSTEQLNWRPMQGAWSVGQCLEHLRVANEVYLTAISSRLEGRQRGTVDDVRLGWLAAGLFATTLLPIPAEQGLGRPGKSSPRNKCDPRFWLVKFAPGFEIE
jgi:hypothetical protein